MRRLPGILFALFAAVAAAGGARASDPPAACLASPDRLCLTVWAKDEMVASFASGIEVDGGSSAAAIVADELIRFGREADAVELVGAIPDADARYFILDALLAGDPALGAVPALRDAVQTWLAVETDAYLSSDPARGEDWPAVIGLAQHVDLVEAARHAYDRGVAAFRSGGFAGDALRESRLRGAIEAALSLGDMGAARDLAGLASSDTVSAWAKARIAMAEREVSQPRHGVSFAGPDPEANLPTHEQLESALRAASRPQDYAALAFTAAIAHDPGIAATALVEFDARPSDDSMPERVLMCRLKAGFAHLLLTDGTDLRGLLADAEAQLDSMRGQLKETGPFSGLGWWFTAWNLSALKFLAGIEPAIPDDIPGGTPFDGATMRGGAAAIALGVAGTPAVPFMQEAMRAMAAVPDAFQRSTVIRTTADILGRFAQTSDICR